MFGQAGEGKGEEEAADGGSGHVGDLVDGGSPGDGVDEVVLGDERGEKSAGGGSGEGSAEADSDKDGIDGPDATGVEHAWGDGEPEEARSAEGLERVTGEDDAAAVVAVGGVAGGEHAEDAGKEEGEAGEAEFEGGVGDLVDLPGNGDGLGLGPDDDEKTRGLVEAEVARTEGIARAWSGSTVGIGHISYGFTVPGFGERLNEGDARIGDQPSTYLVVFRAMRDGRDYVGRTPFLHDECLG